MSTGKMIAGSLGVILLIGILSVIVTYAATCSRIATTPARVISKIVDEDNVINRYEWYYDAYHKCLAYDKQVVNARAAYDSHVSGMDKGSWQDKQEQSRLRMVVMGIRNQRVALVEQYNANSRKLTQNVFKGWSLPASLVIVDDATMEVE